ncbi:hypothetical protein ACFO4L_14280, partial [Bacillus daqingensis]
VTGGCLPEPDPGSRAAPSFFALVSFFHGYAFQQSAVFAMMETGRNDDERNDSMGTGWNR